MNSNKELEILTMRIQSLLAVVKMEIPKTLNNRTELINAIDKIIAS